MAYTQYASGFTILSIIYATAKAAVTMNENSSKKFLWKQCSQDQPTIG